jgi:hypothetical protein
LPVLTRSLPAVRVAVCKEISRAVELRVSSMPAWLLSRIKP